MKKIILLLFLYYSISIFNNYELIAQNGWSELNTGTAINLNKIQFVNSQTGWAGGFQAIPTQYILIKTTNAGINWFSQIQNFSIGTRILSLFFNDANTGYVAGADYVLKTTNGGNNFNSLAMFMVTYDCYFVNSLTGWLAGHDTSSWIRKTTDAGLSWALQTSVSNPEYIFSLHFENLLTGWCAGTNTILKTTNGGANWVPQAHPGVAAINCVFAVSPDNAWVGAFGVVLSTTNGGIYWEQKNIGNNYSVHSLYFQNSTTGYAATSPRNVLKTTNNGLNWFAQMTDTVMSMNSIFFISADTGYVCGTNGKIYKTINGGVGIKKINESIPEKYSLFQNYPNPFNAVAKIKFNIAQHTPYPLSRGETVTLKVFDITGKEVATLVNESLQPGSYEVTFNGSSYASGVYFYQLQAGEFKDTKKFVLFK